MKKNIFILILFLCIPIYAGEPALIGNDVRWDSEPQAALSALSKPLGTANSSEKQVAFFDFVEETKKKIEQGPTSPIPHPSVKNTPKAPKKSIEKTKKKRGGRSTIVCPFHNCTATCFRGKKFYQHLQQNHSEEEQAQILYICHHHKYATHNRHTQHTHERRSHPKLHMRHKKNSYCPETLG